MDRNHNKTVVTEARQAQPVIVIQQPFIKDAYIPKWLYDFKVQAAIVAALSLIFYFNTSFNSYALDDTVVIVQNEYVLEGLAGIPDILTKDGYDSYYKQLHSSDQVPGGRYRPLSIITFAIEQQFFGAIPKDKVDSVIHNGLTPAMSSPYEQHFLEDMHIRHFFNVLWFTLSVVVLLYFLRYIVFRNNPMMAFLAAILFAIHPIHTEVVANVKSRDEIMSLLFMCLTFIYAFRYREQKKGWQLGVALGCYFLAFLSKEYAITLLALLPLAFYLFNKDTIKKSLLAVTPYLAVVVVYAAIRLLVAHGMPARSDTADSDIQVNPYAYASGNEKLATEIATSMNYLKLLVFPHPLSSDYSYNQIPYKDFSDPVVWVSLAIYLVLIAGFFYFLWKRNVLCFAIAFYLCNLLLICNIVFDIGATMGERLIYHASVGFVIALAYLLYKGMERIKPAVTGRIALMALMVVFIVLCGFKTIERNADWKDDYTLFSQDINVVPNSFLVNANVATTLVNRSDDEPDDRKRIADIHRAIGMFNKVIAMQNNYVLGYMNLSVAYLKLNMPDSMVYNLNKVMALYPIHPQLPEMYFYAGQAYYGQRQYAQADFAWHLVLRLNPGFSPAQRAINALDSAGVLPK